MKLLGARKNPQSKEAKAALARLKRVVELVAVKHHALFFAAPRTHEERVVWLRLDRAKKAVSALGLDAARYIDQYRH